MTAYGVTTAPIELGMALFTMVEPHKGHEVAYNRWYERDHFYAGCQIGTYNLGGRRFVATKALKSLRYPDPSPIVPDQQTGSYLALYYVHAGGTLHWWQWAAASFRPGLPSTSRCGSDPPNQGRGSAS